MKTILVAEDDPAIRSLIVDLLASDEHSVIEAKDGQEALDKFDLTVDLVVADFNMPNINGAELFWHIQNIKQTKYILMSGYFDPEQVGEVIDAGAHFIRKPFQVQEFLDLV